MKIINTEINTNMVNMNIHSMIRVMFKKLDLKTYSTDTVEEQFSYFEKKNIEYKYYSIVLGLATLSKVVSIY